eukprot:scaffold2724_cov260-Pinguiococcus_pyrenoidosus.AAC.15
MFRHFGSVGRQARSLSTLMSSTSGSSKRAGYLAAAPAALVAAAVGGYCLTQQVRKPSFSSFSCFSSLLSSSLLSSSLLSSSLLSSSLLSSSLLSSSLLTSPLLSSSLPFPSLPFPPLLSSSPWLPFSVKGQESDPTHCANAPFAGACQGRVLRLQRVAPAGSGRKASFAGGAFGILW